MRAIVLSFVLLAWQVLCVHSLEWKPVPGNWAPSFELSTLNGTFVYEASNNLSASVLVHAFTSHPFELAMWGSNKSIDEFIHQLPPAVDVLFSSTAAVEDVEAMMTTLYGRIDHLSAKTPSLQGVKSQLHFVTEITVDQPAWIQSLYAAWQGSLDSLWINAGETSFVVERLDPQFAWLYQNGIPGGNVSIVDYGTGCVPLPNVDAVGKFALVARNDDCHMFDQLETLATAGAKAMIVYNSASKPFKAMHCKDFPNGAECNVSIPLFGTMISYAAGMEILSMLSNANITASFFTATMPGSDFAIDRSGRVQQVGYAMWPKLEYLAWAAQWYNYMATLEAKVAMLEDRTTAIPLMELAVVDGYQQGFSAVELPVAADLSQYESIIIDASLSCPGGSDELCPAWDQVMTLVACCEGSDLCNYEIGRWITTFHRSVGRWLTDITPLAPVLMSPSGMCNFTVTIDWASPSWLPSFTLRLVKLEDTMKSSSSSNATLVPFHLLPLFTGGLFNQDYNNRSAMWFMIPVGTVRVELVTVITGHGSDSNGCGEFCVTSHHFFFNGNENSQRFGDAGTGWGCAHKVAEGVEPNEMGTWNYGRDGWCDGQNVKPYVADITEQLNFNAQNNATYRGYFQGRNPDPQPGGNAYIDMTSELVFYKLRDDF